MDRSPPPVINTQATSKSWHSYSCILCRQRKIKCDKQQPCLNCIRAQKDCVHSAPAPPRRRKGRLKLSEEQLLRRLRHYEALLKSYGANIEELERFDNNNSKTGLFSVMSSSSTSDSINIFSPNQSMQSLEGSNSAPLVDNLWTNLSADLLEGLYEEGEEDSSQSATDDRETPLSLNRGTFVFDPRSIDAHLTDFHPTPQQIFKLWQVFLENVNPMTKIIHAPTLQAVLLDASVSVNYVSRPMEALMFALYSCALTSLSDEDCEKITGESRTKLRPLYHQVTQQALMRAGLFGTMNIVVLQAAVLFIIAFRRDYDTGELWILMGIVLRIGQRLGLHRESNVTNLSPLEREVRRRLWWQINFLDARSAEHSEVGSSVNAGPWEIPRPLNVNDSDLTAEMTVPPLDRVGVTEMLFPLVVYEVGDFIRRSKSMEAFGGSWKRLSDDTIPLMDKDRIIDELEGVIESKFLRYCDSAIPLHMLAKIGFKAVIGRMRLTIRHPCRHLDKGSSMSYEEKQRLFDICLMMIEQDNLLRSTPSFRGFLWNIGLQSQLDAIAYLLSELRHHGTGSIADRAWSQIAEAFRHHHDIITNTKNPLYGAVRSLTLKSWEAREAESFEPHLTEAQTSWPPFILEILSKKAQNAPLPMQDPTGQLISNIVPSQGPVRADYGLFDSTLVPEALAKEEGTMDWNYWNDLMRGVNVAEMTTFDSQEIYNSGFT